MPLPSDEKIVAKAEDVLGQFKAVFGKHPGFRPGTLSTYITLDFTINQLTRIIL
jgi:hypothetical protein